MYSAAYRRRRRTSHGNSRGSELGQSLLADRHTPERLHGLLDNRPPIAVLGLKVFVDHAPQIRRFRITWLVERRQFGTGLSHEQHATHPTGGRASQSGQPILGSLTDAA
jgi:hypothetical protein